MSFKAVELDAASRHRTGRQHVLDLPTRDAAIGELLRLLHVEPGAARVDPTRTLIEVDGRLWTLIALRAAQEPATPQRRAGAKHKHVR